MRDQRQRLVRPARIRINSPARRWSCAPIESARLGQQVRVLDVTPGRPEIILRCGESPTRTHTPRRKPRRSPGPGPRRLGRAFGPWRAGGDAGRPYLQRS